MFHLRVAAIGIDSNSLRMLVAEIMDGKLRRLKRYREGLRVFAALDANRNILPDMIQKACESVRTFKEEAQLQGAERIHLFATSAVRDAGNQDAFVSELQKATGLKLDVCSGNEEASLSFWGAAEGEQAGLIDIGGGSTEIAIGSGREINDAISLQMGAVRLYRMHPIISIEDAMQVVEMARSLLQPVQSRFADAETREWAGVGGTFTTTAALVQRIPWQQREKIHGFRLDQASVLETLRFLAPMPLEERLKLDCLQPQRADIVVHGIAILLACMEMLHISSLTVSEYGNLEGYLKKHYLYNE